MSVLASCGKILSQWKSNSWINAPTHKSNMVRKSEYCSCSLHAVCIHTETLVWSRTYTLWKLPWLGNKTIKAPHGTKTQSKTERVQYQTWQSFLRASRSCLWSLTFLIVTVVSISRGRCQASFHHSAETRHELFFCSSAALIMTIVTVLDEWRLCASNAILQKRGNT